MGSWHMTIFCKRTQVFRAPVLANKTSRRKLVGFVTKTNWDPRKAEKCSRAPSKYYTVDLEECIHVFTVPPNSTGMMVLNQCLQPKYEFPNKS